MMSCTAFFSFFFLIFCCQNACCSPITKGVEDIHFATAYLPSYTTVLVSLLALLLLAYFVLGCVCCPNKSIKALSYQNGFPVSRLNENNFENPAEITIFPPHSTVIDLQPVSPSFPAFDERVTFEPLPDILPKKFTTGQSAACSSRPAHFSALLKTKVSLHDWFDDPNSNFPREQLQYLQEINIGWFGRVVEGEASQICDNEEKTSVIVKILREEASPSEHLHFLHEVRPYRDLNHSNVIKLLGRCLESDPFLLIMEHSISDLKTYLIKQEKRENFLQDGLMLQMISNITSGLRYMHDKGFCHMDLAAHNCFVCTDNSVKIGDYGVSFNQWKSDYYCLGDIALPIRWYSPEILKCSETTIETKEITREANIWAFGVVLWEIMELGKLPYEELTDEEVLQKVLIEKCIQLSTPISEIICKDEIVLVMRECWKPKKYRPSMEKIESFIIQLYNDRLSIKNKELSFEERWNSIQPRITEISSYTGTESSSMKFENDFSTRSDLQNYSSDNEILSSFEMSFDILPKNEFSAQLSPSLNVLNGSIDELTENDVYLNSISLSCGKYDADTLSNISDKDNFQMEEDKENAHSNNVISEQISAAIRDLDLVLASQPDSSRNSTLQKNKPEFLDSEMVGKSKELRVNEFLKESQNLSKSSDLSNISESSYSKSSNFSEHLDQVIKEKRNNLNVDSDLNGNHKFCDNISQECSDVDDPAYKTENIGISNNQDVSTIIDTDNLYDIKIDSVKLEFEQPSPLNTCGSNNFSFVPDIVIHESPSINASENVEEDSQSENNPFTVQNQNKQKTFRFVFKDASEQTAAEISHQDFSSELAHDLTQSLKKSDRSNPLTSTPVRSSSGSISGCQKFEISNINGNDSTEVFCETTANPSIEVFHVKNGYNHHIEINEDVSYQQSTDNLVHDLNSNNKPDDLLNIDSYQETINSADCDLFTTAQSSLVSKSDDITKAIISESNNLNDKTYVNNIENDETLNFIDTDLAFSHKTSGNLETEKSNLSDTLYISVDSKLSKNDYSESFSDVISPPNGYVSSHKDNSFSGLNSDIENEYLEDSKASETVSPPQGFQDDGLAVLNDSYSDSKTSFDQELSTSAECGSSENLDQYLEDDNISHSNISAAKLLETSFPDMESKSFNYERCADFSGNMRPRKNNPTLSFSSFEQVNSKSYLDYDDSDTQNYNLYKNMKAPIQSYDHMIVEDLDTGEQTVINESYSVCDDYENSGESDEILKINTETDEAIIVDSSEALIGFVPSRSIELLQEFEVIPSLNPPYSGDEEKESSDSMNIDAYNSASPSPAAMKHNSSPYESPERAYPQPYRNFCLQNEVIEEEITDEIVSPSSFHSSSSYCSNEIFMEEEKMSQSSESVHHGEMYETSVMPSVDHLYVVSDDGSKTDISSSECSPVKKQNEVVNAKYKTDAENNHIEDNEDDVMHSYQPTQSVRWLSDETLDVDADDESPIIIEGREILAGDIIQTCELTAEDIASALNHLEAKGHLHGLTSNHLNVSPSPSPFSSVESSPCRETVYTPDFESDSEETASGTSCSSTSGSFECIHNKFKNAVDISKVVDESDKSVSSREQSPMKIFSKTWDCHATPTRGVLVTPEKKFNSMRKSVSFHEEDPQVVFEYPPASDSSEDGYPSDDNNEEFRQNIDYLKYADWDLQVGDSEDIEAEEIIEIEELDSEPYVRRPIYSSSSVGPLNRPLLYTLTTGFSDEDLDLSETVPPFSPNAPSNSPDEEKITMADNEIGKLLQSQLSNLADRENTAKVMEDAVSSQNSVKDLSALMTSVQESVVSSVAVDDIIIDELLPDTQKSCESVTVHKEDLEESYIKHSKLSVSDDDDDDDDEVIEEVIVEELSDDSASDSFEFNKGNRPIILEADSVSSNDKECIRETPLKLDNSEKFSEGCIDEAKKEIISNIDVSHSFPENLSECTVKPFQDSNDFDLLNTITENKLNSDKSFNNSFENLENQQTDIKVSDNSKTVSCEDVKSLHDSFSEDVLVSFKENTNMNVNFENDIGITQIMHADIKSDIPNFADLEFDLLKNPVHAVSQEPISVKQSETDALNNACNVSKSLTEVCLDEIAKNLEIASRSNLVTGEEKVIDNVYPNSASDVTSDTAKETIDNIFSKEATLSTEKGNKIEHSGNLSNHDLLDTVLQSDREKGIFAEGNQMEGIYDGLVSNSSALNNSTAVESSCSVTGIVAQNDTQLKNSSNSVLADISESVSSVHAEEKETDIQSLKNNGLSSSEGINSEIQVKVDTDHESKETVDNIDTDKPDSSSSLDVPKIIVTPASESEIEDELEEYLRGQLEQIHSETSQDFSVTSEYSNKPFDDVFGSYISGDSADCIEAFNFEFENGIFFDDYIDDYPHGLQTDISDRLCPDNGRQKRSSSLPLMTENLSDDDSLTMKSDSSLIYDTAKSITRL